MADILRLVESAQARTAPVQRLADLVAGRFAVGVMAAATATLAFWAVAGPNLFPQVLPLAPPPPASVPIAPNCT
jgi:Cu+-exporting ATPase